MYVMLFYDKYYKDKHEYFLLDTDKEISELGDFIAYYRDKYTKLKDSDIVYSTRSTWNEWHYMRTELPHWYINYKSKRNEDVPAIAKDICKNLTIEDFEYEEIILQPIKI